MEQPIISPTQLTSVNEPDPTPLDTEAVGSAIDSVAGVLNKTRVDKFRAEMDLEEKKYQEALAQRDAQLQKDLLAIEQSNPGKSIVDRLNKELAKQELLAKQGKADDTAVVVRKETIYRKYAAKYPGLVPEFDEVAKSSGLGGLNSYTTQFMTNAFNEAYAGEKQSATLEDLQTQMDDTLKDMKKYAILPDNYPSFEDAYEAYLKAADLESRRKSAAARKEIYLSNTEVTDDMGNRSREEQLNQFAPSYIKNITAPFVNAFQEFMTGDSEALQNIDPSVFVARKNQAMVDAKTAIAEMRSELYAVGGKTRISDKVETQIKDIESLLEDLNKSTSVEDMFAIIKGVDATAGSAVDRKIGIGNMKMIGVLKDLAQAGHPVASAGLEAFTTEFVPTLLGVTTTKFSAATDENGNMIIPNSNMIDNLATGERGANASTAYDTIQKEWLPSARTWINSKDPEIRARGYILNADLAVAMSKYYRDNNDVPSDKLVDEVFGVLANPQYIGELIDSGKVSEDVLAHITGAVEYISRAEYTQIALEANEALKSIRKGGPTNRKTTAEETLSMIRGTAGVGGGVGGIIAPPSEGPAAYSEVIHLDTDKEGNVFFGTNEEWAKSAADNLTRKYGGRLTRYLKSTMNFMPVKVDAQSVLYSLTKSEAAKRAGFPSSLGPMSEPKSTSNANP